MITKKYSKVNLRNFFPFVYEVIKSNKTEELFSFFIWEISWIFFKNKMKQLTFNNEKADLEIKGGVDFLDAIYNENFYESSIDFKLVYFDKNNEVWGSKSNSPSKLFFKNKHNELVECFDFKKIIEGIFIDSKENIFVCCGGVVLKSDDRGMKFREVLCFSSVESRFLFETITEIGNNQILIGEYANTKRNNKWVFAGHIYWSDDHGEKWENIDFLKNYINKHIHVLKWVERLKCVVLTEGDNKKGIWILRPSNELLEDRSEKFGWYRLNRFHIQKGGYTSLVETKEKIILGTDYYLGTNFIVSTDDFRKINARVIPDPYRKSAVFRMLYLKNDIIWASLYCHIVPNKSLLMYSKDFGKSWYKFIEYDGSLIKISIISNSVENYFYVLLEDQNLNKSRTYIISCCDSRRKANA